MLYTIIPPILVIVSLIGIIVFLLKKANRIAGISSLESNIISSGSLEKNTFPGRGGNGEAGISNKFKTASLTILEKIIRKVRVIFLRMENTFTSWGEMIREKRKRKIEESTYNTPPVKEDDILRRINDYDISKRTPQEKMFGKREGSAQSEEKVTKPLLKDSYEKPSARIEVKNQLEKILIERIAANPRDTEAYERLGEYYFEIGNYNHAKECYKQVMKLSPGNIGVRSRMKRLEKLLGR